MKIPPVLCAALDLKQSYFDDNLTVVGFATVHLSGSPAAFGRDSSRGSVSVGTALVVVLMVIHYFPDPEYI